jgi:tetratricopeptide (TPR) repeat protein
MANAHPTAWRMPIARNAHFTGRDKTLQDLRHQLSQDDSLSRVQVLHGPGGIGKTQTAAEFAYRFRDSYGVLWWMSAENSTSVEMSLAELARTLGLADRDDIAPAELRRVLFKHLDSRHDWLLIFDDAVDLQSIRGLWPAGRTGQIIVTSRSPNWAEVARPFPIGVFERKESVDFLLHRTRRKEKPETANKLANALGDLPLALDQAAALIDQTRITFDDYLRRFETHWADLLQAGKPSADYPMSLVMSWELSFKQVEETSPNAAQILAICAYLSPAGIPRSLLRSMAQFAPPGLGFILGDPIACGEAVGELANYSLVDADEQLVRMHPLAAGLARHRLSEVEQRTWSGVTVRAMESLFKFDPTSPLAWHDTAELLPHAMSSAAQADAVGVSPGAVRSIYNAAGQHLLQMARFDDAKKLLERAMEIALALWGDQSPRLSPIANNLGRVMLRTGDVAGARTQFERALALDERVYGASHPHVAEIVNNRGVCLHVLGDTVAAEDDFRRALQIYQFNFADGHGKIASIVNNLGYAMVGRGDLRAAREHFNEALQMAQSTLGVDHPTVAAVLRNLGSVCASLEKYKDAKLCYEQAAQIDERVLGPVHPDTAADLAGLAEAVEQLGEWPKAKGHMNRSITLEQSLPKPDQSRLAERYKTLARIHRNMGEADDARRCLARAAELENNRPTARRGLLDTYSF